MRDVSPSFMKVGDVYTPEEVEQLMDMGLEERPASDIWAPCVRLFSRKRDKNNVFMAREQENGSLTISSYFHIDNRGGKKK